MCISSAKSPKPSSSVSIHSSTHLHHCLKFKSNYTSPSTDRDINCKQKCPCKAAGAKLPQRHQARFCLFFSKPAQFFSSSLLGLRKATAVPACPSKQCLPLPKSPFFFPSLFTCQCHFIWFALFSRVFLPFVMSSSRLPLR